MTMPRDPVTMREVHGLREFHQLVCFWLELGRMPLLKTERPGWENYLISLGVTATRAAASVEALAMSGRAEGMQCIVRQIVEVITRFVSLIDTKQAGYLAELKKDRDQRNRIKEFEAVCSRPWMLELDTDEFPDSDTSVPTSKAQEKSPETGTSIGLQAEYRYLCLSTHNHLTALYSKANLHLQGNRMDSTEADPPQQVERYLHITVDAMRFGCTTFISNHELLIASDNDRANLLAKLDGLTSTFKFACPER